MFAEITRLPGWMFQRTKYSKVKRLSFSPCPELSLPLAHPNIFPATKLSLEVAGMDLATNMALMGCIGAITGLTNMAGLEQAVKDRFLGKGFVVSGGTAALDSVVERKFKKKQELIDKNVAVMRAGWNYAVEHGWAAPDVKRVETPVAAAASA